MHLSDAECGDKIFKCLTDNGPLSQADIRSITGFNGGEFRRGILFIRETLASLQGEVYAYDPHQNVYMLASTEIQAKRYARRRTRAMKTALQRYSTSVLEPAMAKWGGSDWRNSQINADNFTRILQAQEDAITASLPKKVLKRKVTWTVPSVP